MQGRKPRSGAKLAEWNAASATYSSAASEMDAINAELKSRKNATTPVVAETPVAETPVAETPVAETPVAETPVAETPVAEPASASVDPIAQAAKEVWNDAFVEEEGHPTFDQLAPPLQKQVRDLYANRKLDVEAADRIRADHEIGFARTARKNGNTMPVHMVRSIVDTIIARWENRPEVVVAESIDDAQIPQEVRDYDEAQRAKGAEGMPAGFIFGGKIYLIADQHRTNAEVMETLFHEALGHYGLRGVFSGKLTPILRQVAQARRADVEAIATKYKLDMAKHTDVLRAAEEVLANMAATKPKLGFVQRAVSAVRNALRSMAPKLTANMELTDADIIQKYILPARAFVERKSTTFMDSGELALARKSAEQQYADAGVSPGLAEFAARNAYGEESTAQKIMDTARSIVTSAMRRSDVGLIDLVRTKVVDNLATVESRINRLYHGELRDATNTMNSVAVARQAVDIDKMMAESFSVGPVAINQTTNMLEVTPISRPINTIWPIIKQWGASRNLDFEAAKALASRVLEGMRINEFLKDKAIGGSDVATHWRTATGAIDYARVQEVVDLYNNSPELQTVMSIMDENRIALIDRLEASGRMTTEDADLYRSTQFYVPFDRVPLDDQIQALKAFRKQAKSKQGLGSKLVLPQIKGSVMLDVGDVFEAMYGRMVWLSTELAKQNASRRLLEDLELVGAARQIKDDATAPYIVNHYVGGAPVKFAVASEFDVAAFNAVPPIDSAIIRGLMAGSQMVREFVTLHPKFSALQLSKDVLGALIVGNVKDPVRFALQSVGYAAKLTANTAVNTVRGTVGGAQKRTALETEMRRLGITGDVDYRKSNPASEALLEAGVRNRTVAGSKLLGAAYHALRSIPHNADLAVRAAVYRDAMRNYNDVVTATQAARELINFRRRGASKGMAEFTATVPFLNAAMQATDLTYRILAAKGNIMGAPAAEVRSLFLRRALMFGTASLMYALSKESGGDDDEDTYAYRHMDRNIRDKNFVLPGGALLPVRNDVATIKLAAESLVEWWSRQGGPEEITAKEAVKTWLKFTAGATTYGGVPVPVVGYMLGQLFWNAPGFNESPLLGLHQKTLDMSYQGTASTSELAKEIAAFARDKVGVEVSPIHVDAAARMLFSTWATDFLSVTDQMLNPERLDKSVHKTPFIGAFTTDESQLNSNVASLYDLRDAVATKSSTLSDLAKRDPVAAAEYANKHKAELWVAAVVDEQLRTLSKVRAELNWLDSAAGAAAYPNRAERQKMRDDLSAAQEHMVHSAARIKTEARRQGYDL